MIWAWRNADPVYFSDGWWMLQRILAFEQGDFGLLTYLLRPHGDQVNALIVGLYLVDWKFFSGTQTFIQLFGFATCAASLAIYAWAIQALRTSPLYKAMLLVFTASIVCSFAGVENWILQFQTSTAAARFLLILSLALFCFGMAEGRQRFAYLAIAVAAGGILAQGIVVPLAVILPALALIYGGRRMIAAAGVLPVIFLATLLPLAVSLMKVSGSNLESVHYLPRIPEIIKGVCIFVGSCFTSHIDAAAVVGAVGLLSFGFVAWPVAHALWTTPKRVHWATVFFFAYGVAGIMDATLATGLTVLRSNYLGPNTIQYEALFASRYYITAGAPWIGLLGLAPLAFVRTPRISAAIGTAFAVMLIAVVQIRSNEAIGVGLAKELQRGHAAMLAKVYDSQAVTALIRPGTFQADMPALNEILHARGKNIYAKAPRELNADQLDLLSQRPTASGCRFAAFASARKLPEVGVLSNGAAVETAKAAPIDITGFDADAYARMNPDVKAALGLDPTKLWQHWRDFGATEGREAPLRPGAKSRALYEGFTTAPCVIKS